jgi:hypothetical protein
VIFKQNLAADYVAQRFKLIVYTKENCMSNWEFGWTILIVGMGGTLVVLGLFALIMSFLKKLFPFKEEHNN